MTKDKALHTAREVTPHIVGIYDLDSRVKASLPNLPLIRARSPSYYLTSISYLQVT